MVNPFTELLPGLPNDIALECLIRVPFDKLSVPASVCKGWKTEIELPRFCQHRRVAGFAQSVMVVVQARVDPTRKPCVRLWAPLFYRLALFESETGSWSELPSMPGFPYGVPMFCHVVGVGSELVVIGGCNPMNWKVSNSVFIYNFVTGTWRCGASMPGTQRLYFGCASDSNKMVYIAGGHDDNKYALRSALAYDVAKDIWIQLPDMAKERDECKGVFHLGKFHVLGGYSTKIQGGFRKDAEAFDVDTWQWDSVQHNFLKVTMCPSTSVDGGDGRLYMCHKNNVMVHQNDRWQVLARLPAEVCNVASVIVWQGKLLVNGSVRFGESHNTYVMDLENYKWAKIDAPHKFSGHIQSGCYLEI
ncbi:F-box/kelch-repeat protein [Actinidia chinensis var. chinensis]|uniref:F-box/kelch-repeat protein n=1 Tax=Actinidia chinensis var. chinensis TaxID=1590841 RepID=A0A2R6PSS0_ACTCC|nr:F-box/kelch-repeat protein [Actinidia chinensis var. chinensis]